MTVTCCFRRHLLAPLALACVALAACQEGSPSEGSIPLPSEQTPRICPGQVRSIAGTYPTTNAVATVQLQQTRYPSSAQVNFVVQSTVIPYLSTYGILRDSRDTTRVLLTFTRAVEPSPNFPFGGGGAALNGNVDADTFYDVIAAGAAEIVFLTPPSTVSQGPIRLTPGAVMDWTTQTC